MDRNRESGSSGVTYYDFESIGRSTRVVNYGSGLVREFLEYDLTAEVPVPYDDRQQISDVVGSRTLFNACNHFRRIPMPLLSVSADATTDYLIDEAPNGPVWAFCDSKCFMPSIESISIPACFTTHQLPAPPFSAIDWTELVNSVGVQLDGHMSTGQNVLVDLCQIGQLIGMIKNPFSIGKLPKILASQSLSKIAKAASSGYLEYQFGWRPFSQSIKAIANVWSEVRQHQEYLKKSAQHFVSLSSRQQDSVSNPSFVGLGVIAGPSIRFTPEITSVDRIACFSLDILRQESALILSNMDQVISRLGGRDIAVVLWDLVPFSFVVDWFTHVNRFIGQRSIDWNSHTIRRMGYSVKTTWHGRIKCTATANSVKTGLVTNEVYTGSNVVQKSYQRTGGFPPQCSSVGLFGNLNKTQLAEGAALVIQRL